MTGPLRVRVAGILRRPSSVVRRGLPGGPWRVAVIEDSMRPAIEPGDWLLADPTLTGWPRRGTTVVFREPGSDDLAIKRVAARPGDWVPFADSWLQLGPDEAWLLGDADDETLRAAGHGPAVDSRRYGPVPVDALVARAWFRYWPIRRIGRLGAAPADLLERGRTGSVPAVPTAEAAEPGAEVAPSAGREDPTQG